MKIVLRRGGTTLSCAAGQVNHCYRDGMQPGQPHNMAIAEVEHNGAIGQIKASAATANDDAIQFIVDLMAQQGISGDKVLRLYSERQPSPEWYEHFAKHWPNVAVTWSFG